MTDPSVSIVTTDTIEFYDKTHFESILTLQASSQDQKNSPALRSLVEPSEASQTFTFSQKIKPAASGVFKYLILLCPEVDWDFIQSLYVGVGGKQFAFNKLVATLPTLHGRRMTAASVSFISADKLALKAANVNRLMNELWGLDQTSPGTTIAETNLAGSTKGLIELDETRLAWFENSSFALSAFEGDKTTIDLKQVPALVLGESGFKIITLTKGDGGDGQVTTSTAASEVQFGIQKATPSGDPVTINQTEVPVHLLGAFLVQGTFDSVIDTAIHLNWNMSLTKKPETA